MSDIIFLAKDLEAPKFTFAMRTLAKNKTSKHGNKKNESKSVKSGKYDRSQGGTVSYGPQSDYQGKSSMTSNSSMVQCRGRNMFIIVSNTYDLPPNVDTIDYLRMLTASTNVA